MGTQLDSFAVDVSALDLPQPFSGAYDYRAGSWTFEPTGAYRYYWPHNPARELPTIPGKPSSKSLRRRGFGISAYVGLNGHGKTLTMVEDTLPTLRGHKWECTVLDHRHMDAQWVEVVDADGAPVLDYDGNPRWKRVPGPRAYTSGYRVVLSSVRIQTPDGEDHPLYVPLSLDRLLDAEHADILFDEVHTVASSRASMSTPTQLTMLLQQFRKGDLVLRWTAPDFSRADAIIREVTQAVHHCKGLFTDTSAGGWGRKRVARVRSYDGSQFEDFTLAKRDKLRPMVKEWRRIMSMSALGHYDTQALVQLQDHVIDSASGSYHAACGGYRSKRKCSCPPDEPVRAPKRGRAEPDELGTLTDSADEHEH